MTAPLWTAGAAAAAVGAPPPAVDWQASGVEIDSRAAGPGDLFVAIVGDRLDGHAFVAAALRNGAVAGLVHQTPGGVAADDPRLLRTEDTLRGLEGLARAARARATAQVAAVTGSVGKTGVKEMLRRTLGALGPCHASAGNLNNHWGAPLSLARLPADARFAAIELGMNHAGEIRPLTRLTKPDAAIVTRIAPAHTAFFANVEAVADAKAEIFEGLGPAGVAIVNADDPLTPRLLARAAALGVGNVLKFGRAGDADVRLLSVDLDESGSTVVADAAGKRLTWRLGAPGAHWAQNSLAVVAAIHAFGGDLKTAVAPLADMRPPAGRGERRRIRFMQGGFDLIDESYNASPAAVHAAFAALALAEPEAGGRRVVVLGDMLELGERAAVDHADLARVFVEAGLDRAHAAGPECRHFIDALPPAARGHWEADAGDLAGHAAAIARPGDIVLVKGSLGMGMARIVRALEALDMSPKEQLMLFNLLPAFADDFQLFNLFRYLTFRAAGSVVTALLLSFLLGPWLIRWLRSKQQEGQPIRDDGPESHLQTKRGTPTMGGVLILFSLIVSTLLWANLKNPYVWTVLLVTAGFGLIGFVDDYLKLTRRNSKGLSGRIKLALQLLISGAAAVMIMTTTDAPLGDGLAVPFFKDLLLDLGLFFIPFAMLVMTGASNAVNLTDGLDGLAIVPVMIAAAVFALIAYLAGNSIFSDYLQILYVPGAGELAIVCAALCGASLGFLWFNAPPAMVFMGDTGSLACGGALGAIAVVAKHELVLAIVGGLFVLETVSVVVQVASFKLTGKRVFRMAPLHHHFEKKGWAEPTIVIRFWIIASVLALVGLATLKLR